MDPRGETMSNGPAVFAVRNGAIRQPERVLLHGLDFEIRRGAVTVILGPAGSGKSRLLEALSGHLREPWQRQGEWQQPDGASIVHLPQPLGNAACDWRRAFDDPCAAVLLDETDRVAASADRYELASLILRQARNGAVVLVTHDVAFARAVSDFVHLVCAGEIIESADANTFFTEPHHPLARRFVETGNCWPGPRSIELPTYFHWILPDRLAGMGKPGLLRDEDDDLSSIATAGVTLLVSLTERPFPPESLRAYGIQGRHFPIVDMNVPALDRTARLCRALEKHLETGQAAAVHCHAGLGRTGLILASYLVWQHETPDAAIARVRAAIEGAIQTPQQAAFVHQFAASV
jgi:atypical dual specificity phosphatase